MKRLIVGRFIVGLFFAEVSLIIMVSNYVTKMFVHNHFKQVNIDGFLIGTIILDQICDS